MSTAASPINDAQATSASGDNDPEPPSGALEKPMPAPAKKTSVIGAGHADPRGLAFFWLFAQRFWAAGSTCKPQILVTLACADAAWLIQSLAWLAGLHSTERPQPRSVEQDDVWAPRVFGPTKRGPLATTVSSLVAAYSRVRAGLERLIHPIRLPQAHVDYYGAPQSVARSPIATIKSFVRAIGDTRANVSVDSRSLLMLFLALHVASASFETSLQAVTRSGSKIRLLSLHPRRRLRAGLEGTRAEPSGNVSSAASGVRRSSLLDCSHAPHHMQALVMAGVSS